MSGYADLIAAVKTQIEEVAPADAEREMQDGAVLIDVREPDETAEGAVPSSVFLPMGELLQKIDSVVPDRDTRLLLICATGNRSALAAKALGDMGYARVASVATGYFGWISDATSSFDTHRHARYQRHLLLPQVGEAGQQKLLQSRVLVVGAGGLGSPVAMYLAAAGVGTLGIVDMDEVDESNLQRQLLHTTDRVGERKVSSAKRTINALNPDIEVIPYDTRLNPDNADEIVAGYDVVVDGSDNFATRYALNDACVRAGIPMVHGAIFQFEGQVTVVAPGTGPCYRCTVPEPPPPELTPSCGEAGVFGVLPGVIGSLEATETLKLLLGIGEPLIGRVLAYDALSSSFRTFKVNRDPDCDTCAE